MPLYLLLMASKGIRFFNEGSIGPSIAQLASSNDMEELMTTEKPGKAFKQEMVTVFAHLIMVQDV